MRTPKRILVGLLAAALFFVTPAPASAQVCTPSAITQTDMAGTWLAADGSPLMVLAYPCGGTAVIWRNSYGQFGAAYVTTERIPGGGYISRVAQPDPQAGSFHGTQRSGPIFGV